MKIKLYIYLYKKTLSNEWFYNCLSQKKLFYETTVLHKTIVYFTENYLFSLKAEKLYCKFKKSNLK